MPSGTPSSHKIKPLSIVFSPCHLEKETGSFLLPRKSRTNNR